MVKLKNVALLLFLSICSFTAYSQLVPNYQYLMGAIFNSSSKFFYPTLQQRYIEGDTTLTDTDFHHLYYGFTLDNRYEPMRTNMNQDSLMIVLSRNRRGEIISPELFNDVKRISSKLLLANPFDINILNIVTYIAQMEGDEALAQKYNWQMQGIINAIFLSGDGIHKNTPWHVISRSDQVSLVAYLEGKVAKTSYYDINTEYVHLSQRVNGARGFYFDISRIWSKPVPEPEKTKRRFEFNPTRNPKSSQYQKGF